MDKNKNLIPVYSDRLFEKKFNTESAEIEIYGDGINSEECKVFLKMSKEALIGFATYAIRIAKTTKITDKLHWQVDPLSNPCGSQPLGFFLTSESPSFVMMYNETKNMEIKSDIILKEINDKCKFRFSYEVPLEVSDDTYEPFEIGFENIAEIKVIDKNFNDVTNKCINVVLKINKKGLFKFGTVLLRIAHSYECGDEYLVGHIKSNEEMYNFGVLLTEMSSSFVIQCGDCGNVFKYEPNFGL